MNSNIFSKFKPDFGSIYIFYLSVHEKKLYQLSTTFKVEIFCAFCSKCFHLLRDNFRYMRKPSRWKFSVFHVNQITTIHRSTGNTRIYQIFMWKTLVPHFYSFSIQSEFFIFFYFCVSYSSVSTRFRPKGLLRS